MRATSLVTLLAAVAVLAPASANEVVEELTRDHNQWVLQTRDYANTRYSELDQINTDNAHELQVAWTFYTGVQRGHEGGPLVVGDVMYVHTPFPNIVYALYLDPALPPAQRIKWKYECTAPHLASCR